MTGSKTDLQIALVQANPHLGNVDANIEKLLQMRARAAEQGCDIISDAGDVSIRLSGR